MRTAQPLGARPPAWRGIARAALVLSLSLLVAGCGPAGRRPPQRTGVAAGQPPGEGASVSPGNGWQSGASGEAGEAPLPGGVLVVVENHPDARPQSGLDRADVVYEADIVAGITRFLALFYRHAAPEIGPVRSARWAFYDLARGYGLPFAHAGANDDVLAGIAVGRRRGFPDLDEIYGAGAFFWRTRDRRMPHNLYTSTDRLIEGARRLGYRLAPPAEFQPRGAGEAPPEGGEAASSLRIPFTERASGRNVVTWEYRDGRYLRLLNGVPHRMRDGAAIWADNVVVLVTDTETMVKFGEPVKENRVTGEGEALFFTGGRVYRGTWSKPAPGDRLRLLYAGRPMKLAPGHTWVEIVGRDVAVTFSGAPGGAAAPGGEATGHR